MTPSISSRRRLALVTISALALLVLPAAARAAPSDPGQIIRESVARVFAVLRDPALKAPERRAERIQKLRAIVDGVFDWQRMAQSSLGVAYRKLNDAQRQEFVTLFQQLIAQEYMDDLDRFMGDESVTVQQVEKRGEQRVVKTILVTHSRERVPIDYFMHEASDRWMTHDFAIEGISLVNHYRQSFARFLSKHSVEELLARLRARAGARS
jgi:phospholipid transport system substrate-binding protein